MTPIIVWFRRDLRLSDHEALSAAVASGRPVVPVFIYDPETQAIGAAARLRLEMAIAHFQGVLGQVGARLILRRGSALAVLRDVVAQTGARDVYWSRLYDPVSKARDTGVKAGLRDAGIGARSFTGQLLFEPWTVQTKLGGFYKVYTPFWNMVRGRDVASPLPAPGRIVGPQVWPDSDVLADWEMSADMDRGGAVLQRYQSVGEEKARDRLDWFIDGRVSDYRENRDMPGVDGTSRMSVPLTYGEISPRMCWHAGQRALHQGKAGAEVFLKELVWREFAYHLAHHTPQLLTENWKPGWDGFGWQSDPDAPEVMAWKQGRTGIPFVDAAMREMYVTGVMHNRGRMIVGSYLTKHLLTHWKVGRDWFADCLTDWDPASNAMGWQWIAGSGPDAAPYFRVFNPVTQLAKFDRDGGYATRWIAEVSDAPGADARAYFDAVPRRWAMVPDAPYPAPVVALDVGRARALDAYAARDV